MTNILDAESFDIATKFAVERASLELLIALLGLGLDPSRHYRSALLDASVPATPLEHARSIGWIDGVSLMTGVH